MLNLPLQLQTLVSLDALQDVINARMPTTLVSDDNFEDKGIHLEVERIGPVDFSFRENTALRVGEIQYQLPLSVDLRKKVLLGSVRGHGKLSLKLCTAVGLQEDLKLHTTTRLIDHTWVEEPKFSAGQLSFPIATLTSKLIDRTADRLTAQLDRDIAEKIDLPNSLRQGLKKLNQSHAIPNADVPAYVYPSLQDWYVRPVRADGDYVVLSVAANANPVVFLGEHADPSDEPQLPTFIAKEDPVQQSPLPVRLVLAEAGLQQVLAKAVKGQELTKAGQRIRIEDVSVRCNASYMEIRLMTAGAVNGVFSLSAKPVFDANINRVQLINAEVEVLSGNALLKIAGRVFKSTIIEKINAQLGHQLHHQIQKLLNEANQQLAAFSPQDGVTLTGKLSDFEINEIELQEASLTIAVELTVAANLTIDSIPN